MEDAAMATEPDDPTEPPATGDNTGPDPEGAPPSEAPEDSLTDAGKRALAAERKARREAEQWRKDHEALVSEAKARADKDKSDAQKASEALETEKVARGKAERELLRYQVAEAKGVPGKLMRFLAGDTREELEEAADALLAELNGEKGPDKAPVSGRPKDKTVSGKPSASDEGMTPQELAASIFE